MAGKHKRHVLAIAVFGLAVVGLPTTAVSAQSGPSVSCSVVVKNFIPTVEFETTASTGRVVIERRAFNRYWWRGKVQVETGTSFVDRPLPRTAARVEYRAVLKDHNGKVITRSNCELALPTSNPKCDVVYGGNGYELTTDASGLDDVVYRRSVTPDGPSYWRGVSRSAQFALTDSSRELPYVKYHALGRDGGVIREAYACGESEETRECTSTSFPQNPTWQETEDGRAEQNGNRAVAQILLDADDVDDSGVLYVHKTRFGWYTCGNPGIVWVVNQGQHHFYYFNPTEPLGTLGIVRTSGAPEFAGAIETLLTYPVKTDAGIYYLSADGLHRNSFAVDTHLTPSNPLVPYYHASLAAAPNGNVYYVMEDPNDLSRYIMYWDAATESEKLLIELSTDFGGPQSIAVSEDGSKLFLYGDAEVDSVPL